MPFVSITRIRIRSWRYLPGFLIQSLGVLVQAKLARGNLSASVLPDANLAFWSRTVWSEEAATRAFMHVAPHRHVMPNVLEWCDEAAVAHWLTEDARPPSWSEAHRRLQAEGRPTKVKFPSDAQRRFQIPHRASYPPPRSETKRGRGTARSAVEGAIRSIRSR
jgi:Domain of unknown function (DUF3291)